MNLALIQAEYPLALIPLDPSVGDCLDTRDQTHKGDVGPFINFIAGVCYGSAKEYLGFWRVEKKQKPGIDRASIIKGPENIF
jgi:hypothetical protein